MKQFLEFIKSHSSLKINLILASLILAFIPARNYYYSLNLSSAHPLIRPLPSPGLELSSYPKKVANPDPVPFTTAQAIIVMDPASKTILYALNPDERLAIASTTKIMTALIVLDQYNLDDVVTVGDILSEGQVMGLEPGEQITVKNLLYGLLVQSGNDAAIVLASFHPQKELGFVKAMNDKLITLGLQDTHFLNPSGLDRYGHFSTVHDLSLLASTAITNPVFKQIVSTQAITVTDTTQTISHPLETINQLLGKVNGLLGVKTGWTELAGECLVTYTKRGEKQIITVVLGSQDRFGDSTNLIDWAFSNYQWSDPPAIHQ